jgi:hypothetical protein
MDLQQAGPVGEGVVTDHATRAWALQRDTVYRSVAAGSLRRMIIHAVEGDGTYQVREVGTDTVHDEPYIALDSTTGFAVDQYVIVGEIMGRGTEVGSTRVILGRIGTGSPGIVTNAESNQSSFWFNWSDVTNWANAITITLVLGAGTWTVSAQGSVLASHNVNRGNVRMEIDGNFLNEHTLTMVTENRFAVAGVVSGIAGNRTINIRVQFKSFDAGTVTARNPVVSAMGVRTA